MFLIDLAIKNLAKVLWDFLKWAVYWKYIYILMNLECFCKKE